MTRHIIILLFSFFCFDTVFCKTPKNLIYFIGDGMGISSITGARIWKKGSSGKLNLENLQFTGISKTYSSDNFVTDSAASATALCSGVKTYNGSIAMSDEALDPMNKNRPLETIFDIALSQGKSVGIVTTARVTHATPASFYAHANSRNEEENIANQVNTSNLNLLMGGGRSYFFPKSMRDPETNKKGKNSKNVIDELKKSDWTYIHSLPQLKALDFIKTKKLIALFHDSHMRYELDRKNDQFGEPSLEEMTKFAIKFLSKNSKGFFLLVESGRIDHAGHANVVKDHFADMIAFDDAIGEGLKHKKDTLVIVTADHETGGLALNGYLPRKDAIGNRLIEGLDETKKHGLISWGNGPGGKTSKKPDTKKGLHRAAYHKKKYANHTAVDVIVGASGPGSNYFSGFMNNIEIPKKILNAFGYSFHSPVNLENFKAQKELQ